MKYHEFLNHHQFDFESLLAFSYGRLIEDPPKDFDARLPAPPFLMMDRILSIEKKGSRGRVVAEQDIRLDAWYFQCHFSGDPVQPGCLCVDAVWQLMGFYCVWCGAIGAGRALGCGEVAFNGQIRPHNRVARFEIEILRFQELKQAGSSIVIADAQVFIDNELISTVKGARTGIFKGITYKGYPNKTPNYLGGAARS
ncbi:MAG: bifunctional 3-hydroxydecanoyl-ACP dehydratase/trans-2-decenoyl-ACP isomerase [Desulfobacteraceae bacterium]|nr:MAG: bifunctional 3-hydroxydecanoyl-ACP dehydratase/trans-2-decenoyl-ACP isomerase [Desulfobacteraceae bacterium]